MYPFFKNYLQIYFSLWPNILHSRITFQYFNENINRNNNKKRFLKKSTDQELNYKYFDTFWIHDVLVSMRVKETQTAQTS